MLVGGMLASSTAAANFCCRRSISAAAAANFAPAPRVRGHSAKELRRCCGGAVVARLRTVNLFAVSTCSHNRSKLLGSHND